MPTYISETYGVSAILAITSTMVIPVFNLLGSLSGIVCQYSLVPVRVRTAGAFFVVSAGILMLRLTSGQSMAGILSDAGCGDDGDDGGQHHADCGASVVFRRDRKSFFRIGPLKFLGLCRRRRLHLWDQGAVGGPGMECHHRDLVSDGGGFGSDLLPDCPEMDCLPEENSADLEISHPGGEYKMSNKIYLIPETGTFYKANLHCHTIHSDGRLTPEEVKKAYMEAGYSVVAYTDHRSISGTGN